jgi:inosose dehydratase
MRGRCNSATRRRWRDHRYRHPPPLRHPLRSEAGIRLSSLYVNAIFTNPVSWPYERDVLVSLSRLLRGFDSPVLVLGGGPSEAAAGPHSADDYKSFCRALEDIGRRTKDLGIETVYHPHLDTFIERRDQPTG